MNASLEHIEGDGLAEPIEVAGTVKWYDPAKGFGFVTVADMAFGAGAVDILLHKTVLNTFGFDDADEGAKVEGKARHTQKGWQMVELADLYPHPIQATAGSLNPTLSLESVVVKWFDDELGYGFVNRTNSEEDIFLHTVTLKNAGVEKIEIEQTLEVVIGVGPKGKHVKLVNSVK